MALGNKMRIYGPNQDIFEALRGSNIKLILDVTSDPKKIKKLNINSNFYVGSQKKSSITKGFQKFKKKKKKTTVCSWCGGYSQV